MFVGGGRPRRHRPAVIMVSALNRADALLAGHRVGLDPVAHGLVASSGP